MIWLQHLTFNIYNSKDVIENTPKTREESFYHLFLISSYPNIKKDWKYTLKMCCWICVAAIKFSPCGRARWKVTVEDTYGKNSFIPRRSHSNFAIIPYTSLKKCDTGVSGSVRGKVHACIFSASSLREGVWEWRNFLVSSVVAFPSMIIC